MAKTKRKWRADPDLMIADVRAALDRFARVVHRRGGDVLGEALNLSLVVDDLLHEVNEREANYRESSHV